MRKELAGVLLLFLVGTINVQAADFRKGNWGDTSKSIISAEGNKPDFQKEDAIGYKASIKGITALALYRLKEGKLNDGLYIFSEKRLNNELYLDDFSVIDVLLGKSTGMANMMIGGLVTFIEISQKCMEQHFG